MNILSSILDAGAAVRRSVAVAALLLVAAVMAACGGGEGCPQCTDAQRAFLRSAVVLTTPEAMTAAPGEEVTTRVLVVYPPPLDANLQIELPGVGIVPGFPAFPGQALLDQDQNVGEFDRSCDRSELPSSFAPDLIWYCRGFTLTVTAPDDVGTYEIGLATRFYRNEFRFPPNRDPGGPVPDEAFISVTGAFRLTVQPPATPAPPPTPDFRLAVPNAGLGKVYATHAALMVKVSRVGGFAEPVQLSLDTFGSGITGAFSPNPVPAGVDTAYLQLDLPASMAGGYFTPVKVTGTGTVGGVERSWQFGLKVEPLYTLTLATADGAVEAIVTPNRPLDIDVTIAFDPYGIFSVTGPGRIDLSLPDPPPGVRVEWLPDAQPRSDFPATLVLHRTLRLSGGQASMSDLRVRATAVGLQLDASATPALPFVEAKLPVKIDPALQWEYVSNGLVYAINPNDAIGIGMQSDNRPAMAWLERYGGGNVIFLKRFDGTTFVPAPPHVPVPMPPPPFDLRGLSIVGGRIEQARMAMAANDDVHVAFTYEVGGQEGARVGHGLDRRTDTAWAANDEVVSLPLAQHARSPRIAATVNDALALSYIVESGIPAAAGTLFVRSRLAAGSLAALPGPQPDGSINASFSGQVLRDTPSIALRTDGNPWLAWIEERFAPAAPLPPALWLRGHDGTRWGAPIAVPRARPLVAAATQLLVKPDGTLVVAWLEDSPARLMLATIDPVTGVPRLLRDVRNDDGAFNITADQPARDMALHLDPRGRVVVTWTEGPSAQPRLFAKRLNAARGSWDLLGTELVATHPTRSPFVTSDATGRLYVGWTGFFSLTNPDSILPLTDVLVGRWNFTEDF